MTSSPPLDPSTIVMIVSGSWAYGVGLKDVPVGPVTEWWPYPGADQQSPIEMAQRMLRRFNHVSSIMDERR
jgi:hypothetical protein